MKLKTYLVILKNGSLAKIKSSQRPKFESHYSELLEAPEELEHADDAEIIEETDTFGEVRKRVVINKQRKDARVQRGQELRQQHDEMLQEKINLRKSVKQRMKGHITGLQGAKDFAEAQTVLLEFMRDVEKGFLEVL